MEKITNSEQALDCLAELQERYGQNRQCHETERRPQLREDVLANSRLHLWDYLRDDIN